MSQSVPVGEQQPRAGNVANATLQQFRQIYRLYCLTSPQGGCSCLSMLAGASNYVHIRDS